ncbi:MAG: hypothetical protein R2708_22395 [Vicinamibacterales bacterium]
MTGVRAYERRRDLRAYNQRLLDYARAGGTVIVNYNKFEFNEAQYGPYPGKVSNRRVTDENSPVRVLVPITPCSTRRTGLRRPTDGLASRERGTYFFDKGDPQYTDLVEFTEPFPYNAGPKLGALVDTRVGNGRGFTGHRAVAPAACGTRRYRLMANLISLGGRPRQPGGRRQAPRSHAEALGRQGGACGGTELTDRSEAPR